MMALWVVRVLETRVYEVEYTIEADSKEEAAVKAAVGHTEAEETLGLREVASRFPMYTTLHREEEDDL